MLRIANIWLQALEEKREFSLEKEYYGSPTTFKYGLASTILSGIDALDE